METVVRKVIVTVLLVIALAAGYSLVRGHMFGGFGMMGGSSMMGGGGYGMMGGAGGYGSGGSGSYYTPTPKWNNRNIDGRGGAQNSWNSPGSSARGSER